MWSQPSLIMLHSELFWYYDVIFPAPDENQNESERSQYNTKFYSQKQIISFGQCCHLQFKVLKHKSSCGRMYQTVQKITIN